MARASGQRALLTLPLPPLPGTEKALPSPSPGLWPRAAARAFAQFADPKVLHFPAGPAPGKASHVLSCASLLLCGWDGRKSKYSAGSLPQAVQAQVSSLSSGVHSPNPQGQANPTLSDLLWPLRRVLFLTPSWNWLSSSKDQVPPNYFSGPFCVFPPIRTEATTYTLAAYVLCNITSIRKFCVF
uniref:Uncharacterized protein n=1 Tax=Equus asinus asinus TaxID=83772 RepID=A0A8C4KYT9_EQUAS